MRHLHTEIEINVSAETVWDILMDFSQYPTWNPFVIKIDGTVDLGKKLTVVLKPPEGRAMTFNPTVVGIERPIEFRWLGHLGVRGLFYGEHIFEIERIADGRVKFTQREEFRGVLVPLLWKSLNTNSRAGFVAMNRALKERAESTSQAQLEP
jgi:hypothetical protein